MGNKGGMGGKRVKRYKRGLCEGVFERSGMLEIDNCCVEYGEG